MARLWDCVALRHVYLDPVYPDGPRARRRTPQCSSSSRGETKGRVAEGGNLNPSLGIGGQWAWNLATKQATMYVCYVLSLLPGSTQVRVYDHSSFPRETCPTTIECLRVRRVVQLQVPWGFAELPLNRSWRTSVRDARFSAEIEQLHLDRGLEHRESARLATRKNKSRLHLAVELPQPCTIAIKVSSILFLGNQGACGGQFPPCIHLRHCVVLK